jgi:hypothetical protein
MLAEATVLEQVKTITGACDARVEKQILPHTWSVMTAEHDGPDAYRFHVHLVDVSEDPVRILGF